MFFFSIALILFSLCAIGIGIFLIGRPRRAIGLQIQFYSRINWKIEPINKELEVRNTRLMGWFLILVSLLTTILSLR